MRAVVAPLDVIHRAAQGLVLRLEGLVFVQAPHAHVAGDIAARHPLAVRETRATVVGYWCPSYTRTSVGSTTTGPTICLPLA